MDGADKWKRWDNKLDTAVSNALFTDNWLQRVFTEAIWLFTLLWFGGGMAVSAIGGDTFVSLCILIAALALNLYADHRRKKKP